MKQLHLGLLVALAAACGQPAEEENPALLGGTLHLDDCGYDVTTRSGASAPRAASDAVGADPTPFDIHLGIARDPSTSVVIQWRTRDETTRATVVEYAPGPILTAAATRAEGFTFVYAAGFAPTDPKIRVHEVHLCGLTPDTEYSYRVGGGSFSEPATFRTAPVATTEDEVVIAVLGDTRNAYTIWSQVLAKADEIGSPDLVLFTGDAVTLGPLQPEWNQFFAVAEAVLRRVPMLAAHGNHEGMAPAFFSLFAMPGDEANFSLDYGAAHITVLNDSPADLAELAPGGKVASFLDADLTAAAGRPWKIVMHHRPIYSASPQHGSDLALRAALGPVYDEHAVDLVVNGHDHAYERSHPMRAEAVAAAGAGTVYLVSGGAGATPYESGTDVWTAESFTAYHFVLLRVRRDRMELRVYDAGGAQLDEQIFTK